MMRAAAEDVDSRVGEASVAFQIPNLQNSIAVYLGSSGV